MPNKPPRKIPERRCIGCGEHFPKKELMRIVRQPDGSIALDTAANGKLPGRGAYICRCLSCFRKARKSRRAEASLSCQIPDTIYDALEAEFDDLE